MAAFIRSGKIMRKPGGGIYVCAPGEVPPCCNGDVIALTCCSPRIVWPRTLYLTVTGTTATCSGLNGISVPLTYDPLSAPGAPEYNGVVLFSRHPYSACAFPFDIPGFCADGDPSEPTYYYLGLWVELRACVGAGGVKLITRLYIYTFCCDTELAVPISIGPGPLSTVCQTRGGGCTGSEEVNQPCTTPLSYSSTITLATGGTWPNCPVDFCCDVSGIDIDFTLSA